ncbi:hypothetical protein EYF80_057784 [Liparis tanakae]|uniref:Uncharacterized protein n=1 Tax=Liparis tanakae TaxID=230148 RepID=A0A4Z2ETE8_9TELE|nr:hypothetical protein EYF80_057784 [Liparis tanakae]
MSYGRERDCQDLSALTRNLLLRIRQRTQGQEQNEQSAAVVRTHRPRCFKLFLQTYRLAQAGRNTHGTCDPIGFPLTLHI